MVIYQDLRAHRWLKQNQNSGLSDQSVMRLPRSCRRHRLELAEYFFFEEQADQSSMEEFIEN